MATIAKERANVLSVLAGNSKYASEHAHGSMAAPPSKKYIVVTCMDARIDTAKAFGIQIGEAHIIRNAGGSAVDALRSIIISEQLLGTEEIMVVKHTKCGMLGLTDEKTIGVCEKSLGPEAVEELKKLNITFHGFPDLDESVKEDVQYLRKSKLIPDSAEISGWVYDVVSGKIREVEA